jgi:hypothetical protein
VLLLLLLLLCQHKALAPGCCCYCRLHQLLLQLLWPG